jgi:hypothetical protein
VGGGSGRSAMQLKRVGFLPPAAAQRTRAHQEYFICRLELCATDVVNSTVNTLSLSLSLSLSLWHNRLTCAALTEPALAAANAQKAKCAAHSPVPHCASQWVYGRLADVHNAQPCWVCLGSSASNTQHRNAFLLAGCQQRHLHDKRSVISAHSLRRFPCQVQ